MSLQKRILLPILFTLLLLTVRIMITGQLVYIFLAWNLFLAWVPFAISNKLEKNKTASGWETFLLLFLWLLFLPNAPYIITDFFHLKQRNPVPYWYDVLLLFSAAFNGLILGLLSLQKVEIFLISKFGSRKGTLVILVSFFLCAFGIYIGRFLRWNSWDIITNPGDIAEDIFDRLINPFDHFKTWSVTILFGTFLSLVYFSVKNLYTLKNK